MIDLGLGVQHQVTAMSHLVARDHYKRAQLAGCKGQNVGLLESSPFASTYSSMAVWQQCVHPYLVLLPR